ncbi:MAG: TetR/AcrR family transcriptional regulator [Xanthomonadales bacterium]|nr:TetR/AcrR family transcriptional regulator [Xanthomonadales bacterium]
MIDIQRRVPKQSRSIAVVDAILEVTAHILLESKEQVFTTNHIATLAGVSIGSLYQYFPNKESIVAKLVGLHQAEEFRRISSLMTKIRKSRTCKNSKSDRENNIRLVMEEFISVHSENLELARILRIQANSLAYPELSQNTASFLTEFLHPLLDEVDGSDLHDNYTRAYIIANSVDSLIQTTLIDEPLFFTQPEFIDELVNLSMGYLGQSQDFGNA